MFFSRVVGVAAACLLLGRAVDGQTVPVNQVISLVKIAAGYLINDGSVDGTFVDRQYTTTNLTGFTGGTAATNSGALVDTAAVSTDFYPATYRNERNGVFQYTLTNSPQVNYASPPPLVVGTSYTLRLHFAEITPGITQAGQRQFNVAVNGTQYLTNFDIVAEAGGAQKAVVKTYTVTPNASGQIVISFTAGAAGVPKVSALELFTIAPVSSGVYSASASVVYQIAAGSSVAQGGFAADKFYAGGTAVSVSSTGINVSIVNNAAPQAVYQGGRSGPTITYTIPNLVAGAVYTVRLHFAETVKTGAGQRQFNVSLNGSQVLTNFDISAASGAPNRAIVEAFPVAATSSGQIGIVFSAGAAGAAPLISGVEVLTGFRVSAGGPGASYWEADQGYNLGGTSFDAASGASVSTAGATDAAPPIVYLYQRYGGASYTFHNLTPGVTYGVRLHFAELYSNQIGLRQMNAVVNGAPVLTNYDIYANAGGTALANIQEFTAVANGGGQIVVRFGVGATPSNGPCISGIELVGGSSGVAAAGQYVISGYVLTTAGPVGGSAAVPGATLALSTFPTGQASSLVPYALAVSGSDGSYWFVVASGLNYSLVATPPPLLPINLGAAVPFSAVNKNYQQNFVAVFNSGGSLAPTLPNKEYIFVNGAVLAVEHPN